jgi:hypothetical protein
VAQVCISGTRPFRRECDRILALENLVRVFDEGGGKRRAVKLDVALDSAAKTVWAKQVAMWEAA